MKLGFSGTQVGMTQRQATAVAVVLRELQPVELHHGMAIGADAQANDLARALGIVTVGHPPTRQDRVAIGLEIDVEWHPRPYLDRNRDIAFTTDRLCAAPRGPEIRRSGTWSTVRYAREYGKRIIICWPDGQRTEEGTNE